MVVDIYSMDTVSVRRVVKYKYVVRECRASSCYFCVKINEVKNLTSGGNRYFEGLTQTGMIIPPPSPRLCQESTEIRQV